MTWLFLSPHFDDAVYSCGGLIWDLVQSGQRVEILTVCSGEPPAGNLTPYAEILHERWGVTASQVIATRQGEDEQACRLLGVSGSSVGIPDCIYRRFPDGSPLVVKEEDLWQPLPYAEYPLVEWLAGKIIERIHDSTWMISPIGIGMHVDHSLTRRAAELARARDTNIHVGYYADFPYVLRGSSGPSEVEEGWREEIIPITDCALEKWGEGIALYRSQFSSFWQDPEEMHSQLATYRRTAGGSRLFWAEPEQK